MIGQTDAVASAAEVLRSAEKSRQPAKPVRNLLGTSTDIDAAYAVQATNVAAAVAEGRKVSGRKIGVTSKAVQQQIGVTQPDFGTLFADTEYGDGGQIDLETLIQPRAEAEVGFLIGRDLEDPPFTFSRIVRAIEYAIPAIEIVDSRIENWDITIVDTVADNASCGAYVLGSRPMRLRDVDVRRTTMTMAMDDAVVSTGKGSACLGNPLLAVQWLANALAERGQPLMAGDAILSGALGPLSPITGQGTLVASLGDLGEVAVELVRHE